MKTDFVFPSKNEPAFITLAERLGYDCLVFCYIDAPPKSFPKTKIKIKTATSNQKQKAEYIISKDAKKVRQNIEHSKINIFYGLESQQKKDFMHQRASGLNHVLCKLMNKKSKSYAFSFNQILHAPKSQQAKIIGRMSQNLKLCKKYKVKMVFGSFARSPLEMRSPHDLKVFFANI